MTNSTIPKVDLAVNLFGSKTRMLARFSDSSGWCAFNPSVCYVPEQGYLVLLRSANGYLEDHRPERQTPYGSELESPDSYEDPNEWQVSAKFSALWDGRPVYRNRMFIAKLDPRKLTLGLMHEIDVSQSEAAAPVRITRGLEDGRLYHDGESLRISATAFETHLIPRARIANVRLNLPSLDKAYTTEFSLFDSPISADVVEKNWMPVEKGMILNPKERPSFDYIYDIGTTYSIASRSTQEVGGFKVPIRGGSQLVPLIDGTFLAVAHQVVTQEYMRFADIKRSPLMRRRYVHRFLQFDQQGRLLQVTDPFNFLNKSLEFAAGLAIYQDQAIVSFGALDSSAHIASFPLDAVLGALRPPRVKAD